MTLHVDESSLRVRITHEGVEWETLEDFRPHFYQEERVFYFDEAENITHQLDAENQRIQSRFDFSDVCFKTTVSTKGMDELYFQWEAIREDVPIDQVIWPGPMAFDEAKEDWLTLLTYEQGLAIPNTWDVELGPIAFDGLFHTAGAIPVPLFNLVYHDCAIIPWMMEKHEKEDYFLYALLNGGIPYLRREAAYPNIDGSFEVKSTVTEEEHLARCKLVSDFHEKVAFSKMTDFRLLSPDGLKQQSVFDESWVVSIDLEQGSYHLESLDHE